jgi:hypothetical protein
MPVIFGSLTNPNLYRVAQSNPPTRYISLVRASRAYPALNGLTFTTVTDQWGNACSFVQSTYSGVSIIFRAEP